MFGEIVTAGKVFIAGMAIVVPVSGTNDNLEKFEYQPAAISSSINFDKDNLFDLQDEYLTIKGYKYIVMETKISKKCFVQDRRPEKQLKIFKNIIKDLLIDFDEKTDYFDFLSDLRFDELSYEEFLGAALQDNNLNVCNAISIFLSQKDYGMIKAPEENFILRLISSNDIQLQEFALAAILNWDNFSYIDDLKNIEIQDDFLQEDLKEFINQKA